MVSTGFFNQISNLLYLKVLLRPINLLTYGKISPTLQRVKVLLNLSQTESPTALLSETTTQ